jgi:hypothetical protein
VVEKPQEQVMTILTPLVSFPTHQVNLTAGEQYGPAIADIGSGRYIVVWTEVNGPVGTAPGNDLVGQIFDAAGNRFGNEFQVNSAFDDDYEFGAALASRPGGGFIMVYGDVDVSGTSIRVQTRDVNGALVAGTPTTIQADTNADTLANWALAIRSDGSYLVAYDRLVAADGITNVVGRFVSAAGTVGAEFTMFSSDDTGRKPHVDVLSNGNYVVTFEDADDATLADFDPQFQIRNPAGLVILGSPINTGANMQTDVNVAALTGGGFVAVWTEENGDGNGTGIRARIYNNSGGAVGGAFTANPVTAGNQDDPRVVALDDGGFVVICDDENVNYLRGKRFDAIGQPVSLVSFVAGDQGVEFQPAIAHLSDGRFVVGFVDFSGSDNDIWATTFSIDTKSDDFNFDLRSDILWRNDNGTVATWDMNGAEVLGMHSFSGAPPDWHLQGTADFNADGKTDLLWRQDTTGLVGTWHMNGAQTLSTQTFANAPPDWHIQGTGDFNGDNKGDILWRHDSGLVGTWHMNGATVISTQTFGTQPLDWHIEGTGDFNGDGKTDVLWRQDGGNVGTWHMNGATVASTQVFANAPADWHIEGVGDFNGDGKDDILWRRDDGTVGTWHMNGATVLSTQTFANAPNDWHIEGVGDFNADGRDDILWRNDNGTVATWHMNGAAVQSTAVFAAQPSDWHILNNEFELI